MATRALLEAKLLQIGVRLSQTTLASSVSLVATRCLVHGNSVFGSSYDGN